VALVAPAAAQSAKKKPASRKTTAPARPPQPRKPAAAPATPELGALAKADAELTAGRYAEAERLLAPLVLRIPKIRDHIAWLLASARFHQKDFAGTIEALDAVWKQMPASPLAGRGAVLAAKCYGMLNRAADAVRILRLYERLLPQPQGQALLAASLEASGNGPGAAAAWQKVYYEHPAAAESDKAAAELARLKKELGDNYPPPMPNWILSRALQLLPAQPRKARIDLQAAVVSLTGADKDLARVRLAGAAYYARETASALQQLSGLAVESPDADAERLHYLYLAARRQEREADMRTAIAVLAARHPASPWRLETLIAAGNRHFLENEVEAYLPYFRACHESFAGDPKAAYCHWRIAVAAYVRGKPGAGALLEEHLRVYPASIKANSALYFLANLARRRGDSGAARVFFREAATRHPNSYYGVLAQQQLRDATLAQGEDSAAARGFLTQIPFPERPILADSRVTLTPENAVRLERAKLLASAGMDELMDAELRMGAAVEGQAFVMGLELAALESLRGYPEQALRTLKVLAPDYLLLPPSPANDRLWRLAFPLPFRESLERNARARSLDPMLVAGLIRQESEFNPRALSRAKAYGLTQILPSTGRSLSKRVGVRNFRTALLWDPEVNLKIGAYYLRSVLDSQDGDVEATLAAYNAGPSRAVKWKAWGYNGEPAEFIEMIPFTETRDYVQAVQRNAAVYRQLYSGAGRRVTSTHAPEPTANAGAPARNEKRPAAVPKR
jgi:soluble lytic murein transglycosylase